MIDKKIAFLLKGAVSKIDTNLETPGSLYINRPYINFYATFHSINEHFIKANKDYSFDFFIHSWNEDLRQSLDNLYCPCASLYENNDIYQSQIKQILLNCELPENYYSQVSQCLSLKKGCELIEQYSINNNVFYDFIVIYRLDLLLWKDVYFSSFEKDKIYVNNYLECQGDFHFIMNYESMKEFKNVYNSLSKDVLPMPHYPFKKFINNYMKKDIHMDSIVAGQHQEVIRKIKNVVDNGIITSEILEKYGLKLTDQILV